MSAASSGAATTNSNRPGGQPPATPVPATTITQNLPAFDVVQTGMTQPLWSRLEFDALVTKFESILNDEERAHFGVTMAEAADPQRLLLHITASAEYDAQLFVQLIDSHVAAKRNDVTLNAKDESMAKEEILEGVALSAAATCASTATALAATTKKDNYFVFLQKYFGAINIEFKDSKIHLNAVAGCMWDVHKALMGMSCGVDCDCVLRLRELSATVIATALRRNERKTKKFDWTNPLQLTKADMPVGFMTNFATKFLPRLQKKYPSEAPPKLLARLVRMWSHHKCLRQYEQLKCGDECCCQDAWETVFSKVDLPTECDGGTAAAAAAAELKSMPGTLIDTVAAAVASTALVKETTLFAGSTKTGSTASISLSDLSEAAASAASKSSDPGPIGSPLEPVPANEQLKIYSAEFLSSEPLGFYCVADANDASGSSVCRIVSIAPGGQCATKTHAKVGSIVTMAACPTISHAMVSPFQLQNTFQQASKTGASITITFSDCDIDHELVAAFAVSQETDDWTRSGLWSGKSLIGGWAGGAREIPIVSLDAIDKGTVRSSITDGGYSALLEGNLAATSAARMSSDKQSSLATADGHDASSIFGTKLSSYNHSSGAIKDLQSGFSCLSHAVRNQTVSEVINALQDGAAANLMDADLRQIIVPETVGTPMSRRKDIVDVLRQRSYPTAASSQRAKQPTLLPAAMLPDLALPTINEEWVLSSKSMPWRCKFHEQGYSGCNQREYSTKLRGCRFIHVHKPWGHMLHSLQGKMAGYNLPLEFKQRAKHESYYYFHEGMDSGGNLWYTAKYSRVLSGQALWQDIIFVQGGDCRVNVQGVCWYRSKVDACQAMEETVDVTLKAILQNYRPPADIPGPFQLLPNQEHGWRKRPCNDLEAYTNNKRAHELAPAARRAKAEHCANFMMAPSQYLRMEGVPFNADKEAVELFFRKFGLFCHAIAMVYVDGMFKGLAYISFASTIDAKKAIDLCYGHYMGHRYIELKPSSQRQFENAKYSECRFAR